MGRKLPRFQSAALEVLSINGPLNLAELEWACFIKPNMRGGFRASLNSLFRNDLVETVDASLVKITEFGRVALADSGDGECPKQNKKGEILWATSGQ